VPQPDLLPAAGPGGNAFVFVSRAYSREARNSMSYRRVYSNVVFGGTRRQSTTVTTSADHLVPPEFTTHGPGAPRAPEGSTVRNVRLGCRHVAMMVGNVLVPFPRSRPLIAGPPAASAASWVTLGAALAAPDLERDPAVVSELLVTLGSPVRFAGTEYSVSGRLVVDVGGASAASLFEEAFWARPTAPPDPDPEMGALRRCVERVTSSPVLAKALYTVRHEACPWPMAARCRLMAAVEAETAPGTRTPVGVWAIVIALRDIGKHVRARTRDVDAGATAEFIILPNDRGLTDMVTSRGYRLVPVLPDRLYSEPGTFVVD